MKFENIHEFLELVEEKSYWTAADKLFVSQATLSRHIKEMEYELGVPLFNRTTRKIELTDYGMVFLPYAKKAVLLQEEYMTAINRRRSIIENTLTIGAMVGWNQERITEYLADFQKEYSDIRLNIKNDESAHLLFMVSNGFYDFAFVREGAQQYDDGLIRHLEYTDSLKLYVPSNHELASEKVVSLAKLKYEQFLMSDESSLSCLMGTEACRKAGFEPDILFQGNREQTLNYLSKGLGIGIMFGLPQHLMAEYDIVAIDIVPTINAYVNLVYKDITHDNTSKAQIKFLKFLQSKNT